MIRRTRRWVGRHRRRDRPRRPAFVHESFRRRLILAVVFPLGLMACLAGLLTPGTSRSRTNRSSPPTRPRRASPTAQTIGQLRDCNDSLLSYLRTESAAFDRDQVVTGIPAIEQAFVKLKQDLGPGADPGVRGEVSGTTRRSGRGWIMPAQCSRTVESARILVPLRLH